MPGNRYEISSRLAVFLGAALGGVCWAVVFVVVMAAQSGKVHDAFITPGALLVVIAISVLIILAGALLLLVSRTRAGRTFGVALIICTLSGWVVFGTVAVQSWLWRL